MTEPRQQGAWGDGLATRTRDGRVLDTWYPGAAPRPGRRARSAGDARAGDQRRAARLAGRADRRAPRRAHGPGAHGDRARSPSRRPTRTTPTCACTCSPTGSSGPHEADLSGVFGVLPNVAWTAHGPGRPGDAVRGAAALPRHRRHARRHLARQVPAHDGLRRRRRACGSPTRTACGSAPTSPRARRSCTRASSTSTPGTLGASMVEGRISAGVVVGDGTDVGGGASIMGTLSGGGSEVVSLGERCLLGANAGLGHLARRRLRRGGRPVRHGRLARGAAGRDGRQGARAVRRRRAALPPQLADRGDRGAAAQRHAGAA